MSVICQNFVQNAWKKDLCSNCFKSFGDHEHSEDLDEITMQSSDEINQNVKYMHQETTLCPSRANPAPHATWKSLISEKNNKNCQPFKLETGFQGRLLTINKAGGLEKKIAEDSVNCNGNGPNSLPIICDQKTTYRVFSNVRNSEVSKTNTIHFQKAQAVKNGIHNSALNHKLDNKNNFNDVAKQKSKTEQNSQNNFKGNFSNRESVKNGTETRSIKITGRTSSANDLIETIANQNVNESASRIVSTRGILKKAASLPTVSNNVQPRRGSNVGFKDEEPLVIGYGGRDFSPEELEWESASSDGEHDCTTDSTDETEDDKVFSKITKENTEFNSDTSNLLQNGVNGVEKHNGYCIKDEETKLKDHNTLKTSKTTSHAESVQENHVTNGLSINLSKGRRYEKKQNNVSCSSATNSSTNVFRQNNKTAKENCKDDLSDSYTKTGNFMVKSVESKEIKLQHTGAAMEGSVTNGTAKCDKTSQAEGKEHQRQSSAKLLGEVNEDAHDQNNFGNGESRKATDGSRNEVLASRDVVMFSDSVDPTTEHRPWNGGNEILQAINISLTNRHSLREGEMLNNNIGSDAREGSADPDGVSTVTSAVTNGSHTINIQNEVKPLSNEFSCVEVKNGADSISVEPRASFLHGTASNSKDIPCAIYGPASDLFVSRSSSSSSSSSSSEELRKSQVSLSVCVTVNNSNKCSTAINEEEQDSSSETGSSTEISSESEQASNTIQSHNTCKIKPKIPAKPLKPPPFCRSKNVGSQSNSASSDDNRITVNTRKKYEAPTPATPDGVYYSVANNASNEKIHKSVTLIDHYAESNIYHEINKMPTTPTEEDDSKTSVEGRESKLAALAMELEQVRHSGANANTKRQAPAPPKVPDPPLEDPPSCSVRTPSPTDASQNYSNFKGETMGFSSASSTTSSSSQDTESGFTSWHVGKDPPKYAKSKSSFLLTQYSKCKLLAMGYSEDSSRSKKKFSLKKLLKIGKEAEGGFATAPHDPNCPNPKAWKYSDHFERPRAKLEIIHPMDLENKTVTVNPGFDSHHSGSMSTFSVGDNTSMRNSVSSDYGSYYSDTMSPPQERSEANYEYIQPRGILSGNETPGRTSSASPTPSRCSSASQASTLTSGSSKTSGGTTHRPPKPPPPPRAHSLLPGNKAQKNPDGTFKFPVDNEEKTNEPVISQEDLSSKPQAPIRHNKGIAPRCEYDNFSTETKIIPDKSTSIRTENSSIVSASPGGSASNRLVISEAEEDCNEDGFQQALVVDICKDQLQPISSQFDSMLSSLEKSVEDITALESLTLTPEDHELDNSDHEIPELEPDRRTESPATNEAEVQRVKVSKSSILRNKHPPISKSPPRQPPIYTKTQTVAYARSYPWRTLEDSYIVLSSSNREILTKLVNQALRKRQSHMDSLCKSQLSWSCFEIDTRQASSVFAFGDKIAYHATVSKYPENQVTLVITIQQQPCGLSVSDMKYPVIGQFTDSVPGELLDDSKNLQVDSMQATVIVLDRSAVTTVECFIENLPDSLTEENERELGFIILQLIQSLKSFQAQGIETLDVSFHHLILVKLKQDRYHTLVFLTDSYLEDIDSNYLTELECSRLSLCQYALMLLFQTFKIQSAEEFSTIPSTRFSTDSTRRMFEVAILLLSEEKAVSLSQTKTLIECFLWGVTKILSNPTLDDVDVLLHRWLDVERSYFIKSLVSDEFSCISTQDEFYSQFLTRTTVRSIKEVTCLL